MIFVRWSNIHTLILPPFHVSSPDLNPLVGLQKPAFPRSRINPNLKVAGPQNTREMLTSIRACLFKQKLACFRQPAFDLLWWVTSHIRKNFEKGKLHLPPVGTCPKRPLHLGEKCDHFIISQQGTNLLPCAGKNVVPTQGRLPGLRAQPLWDGS